MGRHISLIAFGYYYWNDTGVEDGRPEYGDRMTGLLDNWMLDTG